MPDLTESTDESPECSRLIYIAGIIEENLGKYLDKETAEICWYGDRLPLIKEFERYSNLV